MPGSQDQILFGHFLAKHALSPGQVNDAASDFCPRIEATLNETVLGGLLTLKRIGGTPPNNTKNGRFWWPTLGDTAGSHNPQSRPPGCRVA